MLPGPAKTREVKNRGRGPWSWFQELFTAGTEPCNRLQLTHMRMKDGTEQFPNLPTMGRDQQMWPQTQGMPPPLLCYGASTKCRAYHSSHYQKAGSADLEDPQQEEAR